MYTCMVCRGEYKRLAGHISKAHKNLNTDTEEYIRFYYQYSITQQYLDGHSASQISKEVSRLTNGAISPTKKDILDILKNKSIKIRNTSEAIKKWSEKAGGPWNKNLTKQEHASIQKYADSRRGKNNGYYTGPEESRQKTEYWKYTSEEELKDIRSRGGDTLRSLYRDGKIIHRSKTDPVWAEENQRKRLDGFRRYMEREGSVFHGAESKLEKKIAEVLESKEIRYKKQFKIKHENGFYVYDYMLPDYSIIIEYNGTYWHCDPRKYEEDFYNASKKMHARDIWQRDANKKLLAESNKFGTITLWEQDFQHLTSAEFSEKVYEAIKDKIDQQKPCR